ncbi:plasmid replication initiation protein [Bradyrhizobium sp. USDA 10063]
MLDGNSSPRGPRRSERDELALFRALPGDLALRDAQDVMASPFFSLAKSTRIVPIDFRAGSITIRVEAVPKHGMATIWDADVLIWAASQIVEAGDAGLKTSRLMAATSYKILTFVGRRTSVRNYDCLKTALDRLQSTTVMTSIRRPMKRRRPRFSWINEWKETADMLGHTRGIELILPDWFYTDVLNEALVLTIDRAHFDLTDGLERWLYRLVRKHGNRQTGGWSFDLVHLHAKSGCLSPLKHFAYDLRQIVHQQTLPGYRLIITHDPNGCSSSNIPNLESFGVLLTDRVPILVVSRRAGVPFPRDVDCQPKVSGLLPNPCEGIHSIVNLRKNGLLRSWTAFRHDRQQRSVSASLRLRSARISRPILACAYVRTLHNVFRLRGAAT